MCCSEPRAQQGGDGELDPPNTFKTYGAGMQTPQALLSGRSSSSHRVLGDQRRWLVEDLAVAQLMEQEILLGVGLTAPCGCSKLLLCPFPTTTWYYATICLHDNDASPRALTPDIIRMHWWYDLSKQRMISAVDFENKYLERLQHNAVVVARVGKNLFHIGSGGQVRRVYPKSGDWQ